MEGLNMCVLDILNDRDEMLISGLVDKLNKDGIVSDEDEFCLSSNLITKWDEDCDLFLKSKGYRGGKLLSHGDFYDLCGAVYVLFDKDCCDHKTALQYMNKIVEKKYTWFSDNIENIPLLIINTALGKFSVHKIYNNLLFN